MLNFLYYLALFSLCFGQLLSIGKSDGVNLYFFDIAVALFSVVGLTLYLLRKKLFIPKYFYFLFPFVIVAVTSLVFNRINLTAEEFLVAFSYLLRFICYAISGVVIYNMLLDKTLSISNLKNSLYIAAIIVGIGGFIQLIVLPDFTVLNPELGWDPHKNRLASTFFDPNFAGAFFNIIIAILLYDLKGTKEPLIYYSLFFFLVTCVFLTFSRSAWGMLGVIIFLYGFYKNRLMLLMSLLIVFLAYFAIPRVQTRISGVTDPADSARFRLESWGNALTLVNKNWFLGVGYNAYKYAQRDAGLLNGDTFFDHSSAGSDSSFLFVFVTTGIFGITFFLLWWFLPVLEQLKRGSSGDLVLVSVLVGMVLESQFINSIFYPQILFLLMIMFAKSSLFRS